MELASYVVIKCVFINANRKFRSNRFNGISSFVSTLAFLLSACPNKLGIKTIFLHTGIL
jgi:hypothetical protein